MQLQSYLEDFRQAGIGVVAITYDTPELQRAFIDKVGLRYPLISDIDAGTMRALGILNTEYQPGDSNYGIPYPGIFIVDRSGTIVGKLFLEGYSTRVDAAAVLAFARQLLE